MKQASSVWLTAMLLALPLAGQAAPRPVTVADAVTLRRPLNDLEGHQVLISPDGHWFATLLLQGDLRKDGNWVEIVVGRTDSLEAAAHLKTVARMFTSARRDNHLGLLPPTAAFANRFMWLSDSAHLAFLWSDGVAPTQVRLLDVRSGKMQWLTQHPSSVLRFGIGEEGRSLFYVAFPVNPFSHNAELEREGFPVPNNDFAAFNQGDLAGEAPWSHLESYVIPAGGRPQRVKDPVGLQSSADIEWPAVSPKGPFALLKRVKPLGAMGPQKSDVAEISLVDLRTGASLPLLYTRPEAPQLRMLWSPEGHQVALGPLTLPPGQEPSVWTGLIEVTEPASVPVVRRLEVPAGFVPARWCADGSLELRHEQATRRFRKVQGDWREQKEPAGCGAEPAVRIEWREGVSSPPALFAVERATGRAQQLLDPAPRLMRELALGEQRRVQWKDAQGHPWQGRLYLPLGFTPAHRYPLVLQTQGAPQEGEFSLLGRADKMTLHAAQVLAGRGMAVLQMGDDQAVSEVYNSPQEGARVVAGYEAAVKYLVEQGIADPTRIGLTGGDHSGWRVEYVLTHSRMPFAAAAVSDHPDYSYAQAVFIGNGGLDPEFVRQIGAPAFGEGLKKWVQESPGFNADKVRAPLRLQVTKGGVDLAFMDWEMYARMAALNRPVELVIGPEGPQAENPLQVPSQQLASLEGVVDWMEFWLNGQESRDKDKREQNERWRALRQQASAAAQ